MYFVSFYYSSYVFFYLSATPERYTYLHPLSLHDALPIWLAAAVPARRGGEICQLRHPPGRDARPGWRVRLRQVLGGAARHAADRGGSRQHPHGHGGPDRKSTRLKSSH